MSVECTAWHGEEEALCWYCWESGGGGFYHTLQKRNDWLGFSSLATVKASIGDGCDDLTAHLLMVQITWAVTLTSSSLPQHTSDGTGGSEHIMAATASVLGSLDSRRLCSCRKAVERTLGEVTRRQERMSTCGCLLVTRTAAAEQSLANQLVIQRPDYSEPPTPAPSGRDSGVPWPKQTLPPSPPPLLPSPLLSLGDCLAAHPSGLANAYHHHHHRRRRRPARDSASRRTHSATQNLPPPSPPPPPPGFCHSVIIKITLWILHGILTLHGHHLLVLLVMVAAAREGRVAGWRGSQSRSLWVVYVFGQVWCCGAISPL
ncbi:uncharacterized protein LOC123510064 [Portunus trituberculatus]|uniref:uncharacterized protein LOC123510064 n=1 Tax=Portunus trituberculatus TaxID=210409 RepID=UPI001E1CDB11|nr:uncharacterized protein LOC123510064 [Portunus trituberculatus]